MSTRALLARPLTEDEQEWEGVYLHNDGYPTGAGHRLYHQIRDHYAVDIATAWNDLIYTHRTGYSVLGDQPNQNECYCHDRGEGVDTTLTLATHRHAAEYDFTYLIGGTGLRILRWEYGTVCTVPWWYDKPIPWDTIERAAYARERPTHTPALFLIYSETGEQIANRPPFINPFERFKEIEP